MISCLILIADVVRTNIMIDNIVRQTTVLIAQLASSAGLRAPLAHLVDEVFLSLSRELEAEGVPQKVAADMFGLALRTYQKRVQRLREGGTEKGATLWPSILDFVESHPGCTRGQISMHFADEEPAGIGAVLADLVKSGLASRTGSGAATRYTATTEEVRKLMAQQEEQDLVRPLVWIAICRDPGVDAKWLVSNLKLEEEQVGQAVAALVQSGDVVETGDGTLTPISPLEIPEGAEVGWEAAVLDHYQAMVQAVSAKLQGRSELNEREVTGGGTLGFDLPEGHPFEDEVLGLLEKTRQETKALWDRVTEFNNQSEEPLPEDCRRVVYYFGQSLRESGETSE